MRKVNLPLIIGIILLVLLTLMSFFPEKFTDKDPTFQQQIRTTTVIENGKEVHKVEMNGWGPNEDNVMGTDEFGRDIYSRIIYGTKTTLKAALIIVLLRVIVSIPIGIIAGMGSRFFSSLIKLFNTLFTAIPTLFVAFFILNIRYIQELEVNESIVAFAIVLTFLGWGKLGRQVQERVSKIMSEEFIEGEIAIGKSKFQIAIQNMVPHLIPSLISLVFIEVGLVIFLLAQLSIFNVFVGPRVELVRWGGATPIYSALNPEWGSMLSRLIIHNRTGKFWIGMFPALAFTVGILAFNLTGEGLRIEFEKRTSRVASFIRNIGFLISPRIYFQQIKKFKDYKRPVAIKSLCIIVIITYIFLPPPKSLYAFNADNSIEFIEELTQSKYSGRLTGFEGGYLAGEYIVEKLREYGLEPYDGESYFQEFPIINKETQSPSYLIVDEAFMEIKKPNGETSTYGLQDFSILNLRMSDLKDENLDSEGYIVHEFISIPTGQSEDHNLNINSSNVIEADTAETFDDVRFKLRLIPHGRKKISITIMEEDMPSGLPTMAEAYYDLVVYGDELAEKLKSDVYEIKFKIKYPTLPNYDGRNILAVLPGKNWDKPLDRSDKKEIIMIGSSYDGIPSVNNNRGASAMRASMAGINLEIARVLSQMEERLDKTIVFAFWDGDSLGVSGSSYYNLYDRYFSQDFYKVYYFDIGPASQGSTMYISTYSASAFQVETYNINRDINKWLKKKQIKFKTKSPRSASYYNVGLNMSLKLSVDSVNYMDMDSENDTVENLNKKLLTNMGQYYIDLITMDENFR